MNNNNLISIILQKGKSPPIHYWLQAKTVRNLLLAFSMLFVITSSLTIGFSLYYGSEQLSFLSKKKNLSNKISLLELELNQKELSWKNEREKLEQQVMESTGANLSKLQLIKTLPDKKDLTHELKLAIDNLNFTKQENNKLEISFHLSNQSTLERISGRLFAILEHKEKIQIYPTPHTFSNIKYNEGEFFSIARFRKTQLTFNTLEEGHISDYRLSIIIFSREGNLLLKQLFLFL